MSVCRLSLVILVLALPTALNQKEQDFHITSKVYHADDPPTCNEDPAEYITQAYAVEGYKIVFHGVTGVECHWILTRVTSHHTENTSEVVISEIKTADNGSCIVCQDQTALTSYYIYKVTADSYKPLNFTEPKNSSDVDCEYDLPTVKILFKENPRFFICFNFTGYPPVRNVLWHFSGLDDYICKTNFSSYNSWCVTFGFSRQLLEINDFFLSCTATNEIDTICGEKFIVFPTNHPDEIEFYNPLQSQPSDEVELNSTGFANFTCATEGLPYSQEMRVCQVDYTRAPQCLDDPVELERCCSCRFYNASCPWDVRERSTVTAYRTCTVLTNNTGNYQCQVFNHAINDYQPLGDPIRVVSMHPTVSHDETSLYFDLFIGSSALAVVLLLLVALVVIVVILKKRRRNYKKDYERIPGSVREFRHSDSDGASDPKNVNQPQRPAALAAMSDVNGSPHPNIYTSKITPEALANFVPQMAYKWLEIATFLGMSTEARNIEQGNGDVSVKCTKLLREWIDKDKDVSWENLLEALRKNNLNKVAKKIDEYLVYKVI